MKWRQIGNTSDIALTEINEEEWDSVTKNVEAFLSSCECSKKGLSRMLKDCLIRFISNLRPGSSNFVPLNFQVYSRLLRWCITDGPQYQDARRDKARQSWRSLFGEPIPRFYQWHASTREYVLNEVELRGWIRSLAQDV
jgi:hypothetical protein